MNSSRLTAFVDLARVPPNLVDFKPLLDQGDFP